MHYKPRILGIIPARAGSKGVPYKNIRLLAGKPLIQYTIQSALLSKELDTILISTDCNEVIGFSKQYANIEIPFIRPAKLALDTTPTIDVVRHAVNYYEKVGRTFDYVCLLQPTSPFRNDELIDKTIRKIIETGADSLVTICKVPSQYNPHWTFKMEENLLSISTGDKQIITRRQDLPDAWHRDGKVYITSTEQLRKGEITGGRIIGYINENEPDVNIDSFEDWELAENLLANGLRQ